ncbi:hypothetical protein [Nostoc sp. 'Peltigera malacea cyanobiont' DB3992]|uniref:hypothetical protein n=1 Tax=Nostoc sp. 'Peltigera malacea cyanobiont' DB3992 TaxID=1206980 RepID=UPI0015D4EE39|nr:hypothetical protein [Nostoc sp. 'Peltigera malacea cyanobiont' DB3992]
MQASVGLLARRNLQIFCDRRLVRRWLWFNPFAAEFGSNYDVTVMVEATSNEVTTVAA